MTIAPGPFEQGQWPDRITGHAVSRDPSPRLHGYAVEQDLARHYRFAETIAIALTGEAPDATTGRAFEVALQFLVPCSVAEAPGHAVAVARNFGTPVPAALASGVLVAAGQAEVELARHAPLLRWLDEGAQGAPPPVACTPADEADASAVTALRTCLDPLDAATFVPAGVTTRTAAVLCVLHRCGVRDPACLCAAWILAKSVALAGEAVAAPGPAFDAYAANVPPYSYVP